MHKAANYKLIIEKLSFTHATVVVPLFLSTSKTKKVLHLNLEFHVSAMKTAIVLNYNVVALTFCFRIVECGFTFNGYH